MIDDKHSKLRQKDEKKKVNIDEEELSALSPSETYSLIHELKEHQIELELQNEELRRTQHDIEVAYNKYSELYDFAPVGYITIDNNLLILEANMTSSDILGVIKDRLIGKSLSDFIIDEYQEIIYLHYKKVFSTKIQQRCEIKMKKIDGSEFLAQLQSISVSTHSNPLGQCHLIINDITELKRTEAQLQREIVERKRAEASNRQHLQTLAHASRLSMMGEMTSKIAHEINQPLTAITAYGNAAMRFLTAKTKRTDDITAALEGIIDEAQRAGEIIRHLRGLTRNADIRKSYFNLNQLFSEIIKLVEVEAQWHNVILRQEFSEAISQQILADQILIEQAILNLAHNAIEAMNNLPKNQRILTFQTIKKEYEIQIAISDSGPGLSKEAMEQMFNPFFTTKSNGIGLGLSICQSIVKAHEGHLWAKLNAKGGTTVKFTLPI